MENGTQPAAEERANHLLEKVLQIILTNPKRLFRIRRQKRHDQQLHISGKPLLKPGEMWGTTAKPVKHQR